MSSPYGLIIRGFPTRPRVERMVSFRYYSRPVLQSSFLPRLGKNIFTRNTQIEDSTSSNPLLTMDKLQILKLSREEFNRLSHQEMDPVAFQKFCILMVEIIEDNLLKNNQLVRGLINGISNEDMKQTILASLRRIHMDNSIKLSMIEILDDVLSDRFRELFLYIMETIITTKDENKIQMFLSYLNHLSLLCVLNPKPLYLPYKMFHSLYDSIPSNRLGEFYTYLVNLNLTCEDEAVIAVIQQRLMKGSDLDKYRLRTGELDAKWHDTVKPFEKDALKQKLLHFTSFDMLSLFAFQAIKRNEIHDSNVYLDLLVSKFEMICQEIESSVFVIENAQETISSKVQVILRAIMFHMMTYKGANSSIEILRYMLKQKLEIKFDILYSMMNQLCEQGYYDEAVTLINHMELDSITGKQKYDLIHRIFELMALKFSKNPKVLIGYTDRLFNDIDVKYSVLDFLNDLEIPHFSDKSSVASKDKLIDLVVVDKRLTGTRFSHSSLYHIYATSFNSLSRSDLTPEFLLNLFTVYLHQVKNCNNRSFHDSKISDSILTLFLNYLMKSDPKSKIMTLTTNRTTYELSKSMVLEFFKTFKVTDHHLRPYPFEMMISSALLDNNDYAFASKLIKLSRAHRLPFTFRQIYPFIKYHFDQSEYDRAEAWYKLLIEHGVASKSPQMKEIYTIARELQWDVKGFVYRKNIIKKNHASRESKKNLNSNRLSFLGMTIDDHDVANVSSNFHDNLTAVLQQSQLSDSSK